MITQLKKHPEEYSNYVPDDYRSYLSKMGRDGEWGDHVTLKVGNSNNNNSNVFVREHWLCQPHLCIIRGACSTGSCRLLRYKYQRGVILPRGSIYNQDRTDGEEEFKGVVAVVLGRGSLQFIIQKRLNNPSSLLSPASVPTQNCRKWRKRFFALCSSLLKVGGLVDRACRSY